MRCRGFLTGLRALLPRSDLPGAKQPTPFGVNRYVLLFCYSLYGFFTAAVFFCWPAMAAVIMRNEGFSNLCARDPVTGEFIKDLRKEADKLYICDEQDAAVQKLFPLTGACCCAMSACGGALLDWIGPRWTACFGQTLTIVGWLLLAFGGPTSTPYVAGMVFIGLGADAGFLPAMCVTRVFPGASGFVITVLGSASTGSSAVPLVLLHLIEKHGVTLKQAALGYIGAGPCFAIVVAMLLLPAKNFLVDTDTPPLPPASTPETKPKAFQEQSTLPVLKDATVVDGSGVRRFAWPNMRKYFFIRNRSLPVVVTGASRRRRPLVIEVGKAEQEDTPKSHITRCDGRSLFETQRTESTATEGGETSVPEKTARAASTQQVRRVVRTAGEEDEVREESEQGNQQQKTEARRRTETADSWVAVELNGASWVGGAESTSATAASAEKEGVVDVGENEGGEKGKESRAARDERGENVLCEERREGDQKGGLLGLVEDQVEKSRTTGFLYQALSIRYVVVVFYFVGVAWAGAFYQQAPRRMFSDHVVWIMELLQPFGSIPCVILGRLADLIGILKIFTLINTFGLMMYALSLGRSDVCGYISVICFTLYVSLFTSQIFIYIEKTFSPAHFGKLIGIAVLIGGLLSFVCNPLYETVVVKLNKGNPVSVQVAMVVLMCVQYVWIAILFYLKKQNPHPYRDAPACQELCSSGVVQTTTTQSETPSAAKTSLMLRTNDICGSSGRIEGCEVTHTAVTV